MNHLSSKDLVPGRLKMRKHLFKTALTAIAQAMSLITDFTAVYWKAITVFGQFCLGLQFGLFAPI